MSEIVETNPSYFNKDIEKHVWFDAMVEEYDSIVKKNVWELVERLIDKSVVCSIWLFKVNNVEDGSIWKYKAIFLAMDSLKLRELTMNKLVYPYSNQ